MTTKFLIVADDSEDIWGEYDDCPIYYNSDPKALVIECWHQDFDANVIEHNGYRFVRNTEGTLFHYTHYMTREQMIAAWE